MAPSNKTSFKTYEAQTRLLAAVIATNKGIKLDYKGKSHIEPPDNSLTRSIRIFVAMLFCSPPLSYYWLHSTFACT